MSSGLDARPSAATYDLEDLLRLAWEGFVRVPHFQRDFRWGREDVIRLFDSIARGYPIGSLLFWVRPAPAGPVRLGALRIAAPRRDRAFWVVDGQQRITSLASALHASGAADPRFALAYDLRAERFVPRAVSDESSVIPLPVIYDLQALIKWFADHPEVASRLDQATTVAKTLRQFKVPAYLVDRGDETVLRDIFDRMNNYGKRLSRAEIFSALYSETEPHHRDAVTISSITEGIDAELSFGQIDADTVLRAILARRGSDVTREIRAEFSDEERRGTVEFPDETRDVAFRAGEDALRRAVVFLQNVAGVPHFTFLPYRYLLVVLSRVFAHHPEPDARNAQLLRRWYWRAAVVGLDFIRSGSTTEAMRLLCRKVLPDSLSGSVQGLLDELGDRQGPVPNLASFRTNTAATKITLCAWWDRGPRSPWTGLPYDRAALAETIGDGPTASQAIRYITPYRAMPASYRQSAAGRLLMPSPDEPTAELDEVLAQRPLTIDEDTWAATLASHTITPALAGLLAEGSAEAFLETRQEHLQAQLIEFLQTRCEWGYENTPPLEDLVVEDLASGAEGGA